MTSDLPTFAFVGAVNHGKSSVAATLAENDRVIISERPGETVECQSFILRDLFRFYDTPGFQNPIGALRELAPAASAAREPLNAFRAFVKRHRGDAAFEAECRLFAPLIQGAGVIYVVDASEPLIDLHRAEMEILRLTAQPRLAILQRTRTDDRSHEWLRPLAQHFNLVREFDSHRASFLDRIDLLESLARIEQRWQPRLLDAIRLYRADRAAKIDEAATIVADLLLDTLAHRETSRRARPAPAGADAPPQTVERLKNRFVAHISKREADAHDAIIGLFDHRLIHAERSAQQAIGPDLFAEESWSAFGLDTPKLIAAGASVGAAAGLGIDALAFGHTLLAGATIGGALGAAGAWIAGRARPEIDVRAPWDIPLLRGSHRWAGIDVVVGPYSAPNFPWILLDRALGVFCHVARRPHARRDPVTLSGPALREAMDNAKIAVADWAPETRAECAKIFSAIRKGRVTPRSRAHLISLIRPRLAQADH